MAAALARTRRRLASSVRLVQSSLSKVCLYEMTSCVALPFLHSIARTVRLLFTSILNVTSTFAPFFSPGILISPNGVIDVASSSLLPSTMQRASLSFYIVIDFGASIGMVEFLCIKTSISSSNLVLLNMLARNPCSILIDCSTPTSRGVTSVRVIASAATLSSI